jgi:trimeric autotransporter adhesin
MSDQNTFLTGIEILDSSVSTSSTASLYTYGGISILNTNTATDFNNAGSFLTLGGASISKNTIIGGDTRIFSTTVSSNTSTGSLIVNGGIGIQGSVYGILADFSNIQATNATLPNLISSSASIGTLSLSTFNPANITTNNLVVTNGTSIANAVFTNVTTTNLALANNFSAQTINVTSTTESINTSTGALIIRGGVGIQNNLNVNSNLKFNNTSGAFIIIDTPGFLRVGSDSQFRTHFLVVGDTFGIDPGRINYKYQNYISFDNVDGISTSIERMRITANGDLGIGTTSPSSKLHVIGNTIITENTTIGTGLFTPSAIINNLRLTSLTTGSAYFNSTTISSNTGSGAIVINGGLGIGGSVNIGGNTLINGNLTVNGTTVSVNSTTVNINDNIIILNSGPSGVADGGLLINRYQITNNAGTGDVVSDTIAFTGTVQTGTSTSVVVLPSGASAIDGFYNNYWIKITSGTANNNVRQITGYVGATKTATLNSVLTATPTANTDTFNLYGNVYITNYFKESTNEYTISFTNSTPGSIITDTNYANLRISNLTGNLVSASNLVITNATISNFTLPTNVTFSNLLSTNSTLTNLINTNQTVSNLLSTNNTLTNLLNTNQTVTNLLNTNLIGTNQTVINLLSTNNTLTNLIVTNNTLTNLLSTSGTIATLINTNLIGSNQTVTNIIATNFTAGTLTTTNLNLTNLTTLNSRITSETIGSILATNINTTNFTVASLNVSNLTSANAFFTNLITTNLISTTNANMAGITLQYYTGSLSGSWINIPVTAGSASGIGSGGPGANPWIAYAGSAGYWFSNSQPGDICYRNLSGDLQFGNSTGVSTMHIDDTVNINSTVNSINSTTAALVISGGVSVGKTVEVFSSSVATNISTGALIIGGGAGFNGDIYAKNIYSNGALLSSGGGGIWGSNYEYTEIKATAGTTSNLFQLRMSLTTGNLEAGTYHIHTCYNMFAGSVTNQNSEFRSLLDATALSTGTLLHQSIFRPNNTGEIHTFTEITNVTLGSGIHTLSLIYRNIANGSVTNISNTKLELYRIA